MECSSKIMLDYNCIFYQLLRAPILQEAVMRDTLSLEADAVSNARPSFGLNRCSMGSRKKSMYSV